MRKEKLEEAIKRGDKLEDEEGRTWIPEPKKSAGFCREYHSPDTGETVDACVVRPDNWVDAEKRFKPKSV